MNGKVDSGKLMVDGLSLVQASPSAPWLAPFTLNGPGPGVRVQALNRQLSTINLR